MNVFRLKTSIGVENFIVLVLPYEYNVILDELNNALILVNNDALTIKILREKLNHKFEKKTRKMEKKEKEKALTAYEKA